MGFGEGEQGLGCGEGGEGGGAVEFGLGKGRLRCVCFFFLGGGGAQVHVLFFWGGGGLGACAFFFFNGGGRGCKKATVLGNSCDRGSHSELKSLTPCRYFCLGEEREKLCGQLFVFCKFAVCCLVLKNGCRV